ncbi:MAG: 6-hydroxymethylpterin diphosphokinase MptE-like protein [Salinirussus sp.]
MNFTEWEPVYQAILADFGFDRAADERARDLLAASFADAEPCDLGRLDTAGATVAVAGGAPSLEAESERAAGADLVVAASDAADRLVGIGVEVDCMVTDLDKAPGTAVELAATGTPVLAHAHGDNVPAVREYGPRLAGTAAVPTTQAAPAGPVRNFGGFTDGDRAAFLADALGADRLVFPGWNFDDPSVDPLKRRKLAWAERLLAWLERRRGETFGVLDGRRADVDTSGFPG